MCGIAGIIGNHSKEQTKYRLENMLQAIVHRGPDSFGMFEDDSFAFGMRRLSIIDIPGGDQPLFAEDGVGIIFNGEIYNYKTIRDSLKQSGFTFKTRSDTETILHLYRRDGIEGIHQLEGMFALCLYDPNLKKMFLVRDRLGKKPLYYASLNNKSGCSFVFSSEIKSLLQGLSNKPIINLQAIHDYLTFRYIPSPDTIWQNVNVLEPGHYLEYNLLSNQYSIHRYWQLNIQSIDAPNRNYLEEFESLFLNAVSKRLLASDVPVGILLSGGLDSSAVAAAAVELGHENFHTFSIGFENEPQFNELSYASLVSRHIRSQHHPIAIGQKEFLEGIPKLVYYADQPLADLASIPHYYVSKYASDTVKVVLSGEGSDEILAGYSFDKMAKQLSLLSLAHRFLPKSLLSRLPFHSFKVLSQSGLKHFLRDQNTHITNIFSEPEKQTLWKEDFKNQHQFTPYSSYEKLQAWYNEAKSDNPIEQLQQVYCRSWLVENLLMKADKMSMANSLELRVPFLDHHLVEWASQLPLRFKTGDFKTGFTTKRILRAFAEKRLPKEIIQRPKWGFPVPAYQWLQGPLNDFARKEILDGKLLNYFTQDGLIKVLNNKEKNAHQIWSLIILNRWLEHWL